MRIRRIIKSMRIEMPGSGSEVTASDDATPLGVLATIDFWCNIRGLGQWSKVGISLAQC